VNKHSNLGAWRQQQNTVRQSHLEGTFAGGWAFVERKLTEWSELFQKKIVSANMV